MTIEYRAAVLHGVGAPMTVETVVAGDLGRGDVLVRIKAAGLCHTDLEVVTGSLRYPLPIVLGHEAAGIVEELGSEARGPGIASIASAICRSCARPIWRTGRRRSPSMARPAQGCMTGAN